MVTRIVILAAAVLVGAVLVGRQHPVALFEPSKACMSCHNGLVTPSGEDISFGSDWRASMMANAARDPYWQAGVRREIIDHPESQELIEEECSTCHMPMAHFQALADGATPGVFEYVDDPLAADGVSCTTCHQILPERFGMRESFNGGFVMDTLKPLGQRDVFGPYPVDDGRVTLMHSASGFRPAQADHLRKSEMCATCHTLYTTTLGPAGEAVGELPEQVPFLEWQHSAYRDERSCQSCHMPAVEDSTAISSVLGVPRAGVSRHTFRGANFFMLRMLNRYRNDLGVEALPGELDTSVNQTLEHLRTASAHLSVENIRLDGGRLGAEVVVENLAGHKLPTAYPSRRVWIHFIVRDRAGRTVFESGALQPDGSIAGNDNDADADRFEPHYREITRPDEVQIYEPIMADPMGIVTTGLLTATHYVKDNRLLPAGFDKSTAQKDIAVQGGASADEDFDGGSDRVRYLVSTDGSSGPFTIEAELWYQPIGFRWAQNLRPYDAMETARFVRLYESMAGVSGTVLATANGVFGVKQ